jgi:hypothetical protein
MAPTPSYRTKWRAILSDTSESRPMMLLPFRNRQRFEVTRRLLALAAVGIIFDAI